jgi:hypothetical protein
MILMKAAQGFTNSGSTRFYFVCGSRYMDSISARAASKIKLSTWITGQIKPVSMFGERSRG